MTVLVTVICTTATLVAAALVVANWYEIVQWGFRHIDHDHTVRSGGRWSTTNPDTIMPFTGRCAKCGLPAPSRMRPSISGRGGATIGRWMTFASSSRA